MIKAISLALACAFFAAPAIAKGGSHGGGSHSIPGGSHAVRAHVTKTGTHVAATRATNPNSTQRDNYSAAGNVNPANGKVGTKTPKR